MKRSGLVLLALALLAIGCGNAITTEIIGATSVSVDAERNPVVLIELCKGTIDQVRVSGTREGLADDAPNPTYGEWESVQPQGGSISIDLGTGASGWTGPGLSVAPDRRYIVDAGSATADVATTQVVFSGADLARLQTGEVVRGDGELVSREVFETDACRRS